MTLPDSLCTAFIIDTKYYVIQRVDWNADVPDDRRFIKVFADSEREAWLLAGLENMMRRYERVQAAIKTTKIAMHVHEGELISKL